MKKIISKIYIALLGLALNNTALAQQNAEERIPFRIADGEIILKANVGGENGDFILDTRGRLALTESAAKKRGITPEFSSSAYQRPEIKSVGSGVALGFSIGKSVAAQQANVIVIKEQEQLKAVNAVGYLGIGNFANQIVAIDKKSSSLILSKQYKPAFIKLSNRSDLRQEMGKLLLNVELNGQNIEALLDLKQTELFRLGNRDKDRFDSQILQNDKSSLKIAQTSLPLDKISIAQNEVYSLIGKSILDEGVIVFDVAKGKYYFQSYQENYTQVDVKIAPAEDATIVQGKVNPIDKKYFLEHVYDYNASKIWKTKGNKPVVIDFWASWCGPCLQMMPVMEELAEKYKDKILFYKVNVDKEGELRRVFEANAIPLLIFGPLQGKEIRDVGADSKEKIEARLEAMLK
ncbi:MAG: thioredoxin [Chitinophagaceae bacterium]|nr:MAG: thioredoxin [Chitinophagaceae bacterium]